MTRIQAWWDYMKLWKYALGTPDPLSHERDSVPLSGAGISQPDAIPDIRQDGSFWGGERGLIPLRDSNEMIDLSSISNRQSRYKEYERLRNIAEIETAMTVFADESCLAGPTLINTLFYGLQTIEWLEKNKKDEEFLVYCWDFEKDDYTLGWAYNPRKVKDAPTVKIMLDDGTYFVCTPDHRVLTEDGEWVYAGDLQFGNTLKPFYRVPANQNLNGKIRTAQFPRIFTFNDGWKNERQFINEWKSGRVDENSQEVYKSMRLLAAGLTTAQVAQEIKHHWMTVESKIAKAGFSVREVRLLGKKEKTRRVVGVLPWQTLPVYDLSVKDHANFCGQSIVFHNCQTDDDGHLCKIKCKNQEIKQELEFLLFHRQMINVDRKLWSWVKNLYIFGDWFGELIIDPNDPKSGIYGVKMLPVDSMFRIETTKGRLVEFQQSREGPDRDSLTRAPVTQASDQELRQATAIRFDANQIIHMRIGDDRKTFYPYGVSLIEAARGPAHQLRLMEDAMVVYRLVRAPERRVFYIDVGNLAPFRAEAFMERMKDQFRKKKLTSNTSQRPGASQVEERWHAPAADEDFWIPIRAQSNTRVETLPGASNLGEIDDAVYFRNKLFTAMNFPKNYFSNEDPQTTRITLSALDIKFARQIERLQATVEDALWEMCDRHLKLRGVPSDLYDDLKIELTAPSDHRELSRAEVVNNRIQNATNLKGSQLFADYDIYVDWMKLPDEEAREKLARLKIQKLEDLKIQVLAQNPIYLGVAPPPDQNQQLGAAPGGPSPMLGGPGGPEAGGGPMGGMGGMEAPPPGPGGAFASEEGPPEAPKPEQNKPLPDPSDDDIKKYNLEIQDYGREQDIEDIDYTEL